MPKVVKEVSKKATTKKVVIKKEADKKEASKKEIAKNEATKNEAAENRVVSEKSTMPEARPMIKKGNVQPKYYPLKKLLLDKEKENYSKIYFLWQKDEWYRAFGHSALIFHYDIAKKLKRSAQLLPDRDYGPRSEEGVVNVRDMVALEKKLEKIAVQKIGQNENFFVFNAGKKYTDTDFRYFQENQDRERAAVNSIVVPSDVFPHLLKLLRQAGRMVYHNVAKMDRNAREILGQEVARRMAEVVSQYSLMTKYNLGVEAMNPDEYLQYVRDSMFWLQARMGMMMDFQVVAASEAQKILIISGKIVREVAVCQADREKNR